MKKINFLNEHYGCNMQIEIFKCYRFCLWTDKVENIACIKHLILHLEAIKDLLVIWWLVWFVAALTRCNFLAPNFWSLWLIGYVCKIPWQMSHPSLCKCSMVRCLVCAKRCQDKSFIHTCFWHVGKKIPNISHRNCHAIFVNNAPILEILSCSQML